MWHAEYNRSLTQRMYFMVTSFDCAHVESCHKDSLIIWLLFWLIIVHDDYNLVIPQLMHASLMLDIGQCLIPIVEKTI